MPSTTAVICRIFVYWKTHQSQTKRLNKAQEAVLQIFEQRTMTDAEVMALRRVLVNHLSGELDEEVSRVVKKKKLTPSLIKQQTAFANRTAFLNSLRDKDK